MLRSGLLRTGKLRSAKKCQLISKKKHFQSCFNFSKLWKNIIEMVVTCNYDLYEEYSFFY